MEQGRLEEGVQIAVVVVGGGRVNLAAEWKNQDHHHRPPGQTRHG